MIEAKSLYFLVCMCVFWAPRDKAIREEEGARVRKANNKDTIGEKIKWREEESQNIEITKKNRAKRKSCVICSILLLL